MNPTRRIRFAALLFACAVAKDQSPCAATFAWMSGLPMYVYHSGAGVFGKTRFQDAEVRICTELCKQGEFMMEHSG